MVSATMLDFSKSLVSNVVELVKVGLNADEARISGRGKDGMPGTATAALGTAHEVRIRRAEGWAAGRKKKMEAGTWQSRSRGKGAQLRRQVVKKQKVMDDWRRQQQAAVGPGMARSGAQGRGRTRDVSCLLGESRCRQRRAEKQAQAAQAAALEAERQMGYMAARLERNDVRHVGRLVAESIDAASKCRVAQRRVEEIKEEQAITRLVAQRNVRYAVEEAEVGLRVLRLELEVAERGEVCKELYGEQGAERTARKAAGGNGRMHRVSPKQLLLPPRIPTPPPPPATHATEELVAGLPPRGGAAEERTEAEAAEEQLEGEAEQEPAAPPTPPSLPPHPLLEESEAETEGQRQHTIWITLADGHREGQLVEAEWQGVVLLVAPPEGLQPGGKFRAVLPDWDSDGRRLLWKEDVVQGSESQA
jgi:hypothetical protein